MEKRKLLLLTLSSDSDLGNLFPSPLLFPSWFSLCLLFFLRFLHSLALLELNFDASDELSKSSPNPPIPLKSLEAADAAATACVNKTRHYLEHAALENSWLQHICCHLIQWTIFENVCLSGHFYVLLQESLLNNDTFSHSIKQYVSLWIRKVWFGTSSEVFFLKTLLRLASFQGATFLLKISSTL